MARYSLLFILIIALHLPALAQDGKDWPNTDFKNKSINLKEVVAGGPPKDGIPAIDEPKFNTINEIKDVKDQEPVITVEVGEIVKAYPMRYLMFHEIVNDTVGDLPLTITYCPLCNTSLVFKRTVNGEVLDFGTSGKLRLSNMVMYDRQTESWWQQATGQSIVGKYNKTRLTQYPSRVESFAKFKERHPNGQVLVPKDPKFRPYGYNPYNHYDSLKWPFYYKGKYKGPPNPMARVVAIADKAWSLELVREKGKIEHDGITITWTKGQSSPVDHPNMFDGKDIGNVVVTKDGKDVAHDIPFAFVFKAFNPKGTIYTE